MTSDTSRGRTSGAVPELERAADPRRLAARVARILRRGRGSRARLAVGNFLLGMSLVAVNAEAQGVALAPDSSTHSPAAPSSTDLLEEQMAGRVAAAVCDSRVVLLGELPEHGHARAFGVKARVVERLVRRCGFRAVLFEAGSYDFFGLERAIAAGARAAGGADSATRSDSLELALARAIGGLWWTRELAGWRRWLVSEAVSGRVRLGGIDDQPGATSAYAKATLPGLVGAAAPAERAAECREAVTRYMGWKYTEAQRYDSTERARLADCARLAAGRGAGTRGSSARRAERRSPDEVMLHDIANYFARERMNGAPGAAAPPDRDLVMAEHVAWWLARLPRNAKVVVWTATTHAARARGTPPVLPPEVPTLGARLAERWGDRLAVVGFTALAGQWSRAGRPSQSLAPLPPDALEARALAAGPAGDAAAWAWLDREALRAAGAVPSRLLGRVATTDWSTVFDGVLVIRDEGAPTFEPRR